MLPNAGSVGNSTYWTQRWTYCFLVKNEVVLISGDTPCECSGFGFKRCYEDRQLGAQEVIFDVIALDFDTAVLSPWKWVYEERSR
ncbi:MAG: hypothetical protein IPL21_14595 [Saprospirales bacterium]|nr:hypothetical protein [Saprospirales bacterium]